MGLYQSILQSADGGAFINVRDSAGVGITSTLVGSKQSLDVNIANSTTLGVPDETAFTYGTTNFSPIGGVFQDTSPTLSAGQSGAARLTTNRGFHVNLRTAAGVELGDSIGDALFTQDNNSLSILTLMQSSVGTITNPAISTSSSTALASNSGRKGFSIYNPTSFTVYLAFAATASLSAYTVAVRPNAEYEMNSMRIYTGIITQISTVGATGSLQVTELT